jgi:hypothetical protein
VPKTTLHITNLKLTTTSSAGLIEHFLPYHVSSVRLNADKGFAMLDVDAGEVDALIADKNGSMYHGRLIRVAPAIPKFQA